MNEINNTPPKKKKKLNRYETASSYVDCVFAFAVSLILTGCEDYNVV